MRLRYLLEDRASRGLAQMEQRAAGTARGLESCRSALGSLAAMAAGAFTFNAAQKSLIGYNDEMEQARLTTAAMLDLYSGNSGNMGSRIGEANALMGQLVQRAKTSTATTAELVKFMTQVVGPVKQAGLQTKDLADFTANAVIAAKAFNIEGEIAARDIQQGLLRGARADDLFSKQLLGAVQMTTEQFNKLSTSQRLAVFQAALKHKTITELGVRQANTFSGIWSTIKDQIQIGLGQVGLPLFRTITAELIRWNQWIDQNQDKLAMWASDFGQKLVSAFGMAKQMVGWLVEHKDLLMMLAKAFLLNKAAKMALEPFAALGKFLTSTGGGAFSLANAFGTLQFAVVSLSLALDSLANNQEKSIQARVDQKSLTGMLDKSSQATNWQQVGNARAAMADLRASGVVTKGGIISHDRVRALAKQNMGWAMSRQPEWLHQQTLQTETNRLLAQIKNAMVLEGQATRQVELQRATQLANGFSKSVQEAFLQAAAMTYADRFTNQLRRDGVLRDQVNPNINVKIERIEAKTEDPDRFAFLLQSSIRNVGRNPSAAAFDPMRYP